MKRIHLLFSIVIAMAMFFVASGVRATVDCPPTGLPDLGVPTPPRECIISIGCDKYVKIEAGPSDLGKPFPFDVGCPPGFPGTCLEWQYRWTFVGINPSEALVSVDSDIAVFSSNPPGAVVSKIIPIVAEGERLLKFSGATASFIASYTTPGNVTAGTLTAGFTGNYPVKLGSKTIPMPAAGKCALAGANNVVLQPSQAVADDQTYRAGDCLVAFKVNSEMKVIPGTIILIEGNPETCITNLGPEELTPLIVEGEDEAIRLPSGQFTFAGSCKYCWINTAGGKTCVNCTDCCRVGRQCLPASQCPPP